MHNVRYTYRGVVGGVPERCAKVRLATLLGLHYGNADLTVATHCTHFLLGLQESDLIAGGREVSGADGHAYGDDGSKKRPSGGPHATCQ